jgi:serine protease Do
MIMLSARVILPGLALGLGAAMSTAAAQPNKFCRGEYAEDISALSLQARAIEAADASYSYAVRTSATYECVSYGSDGNLKKARVNTMAYGTAFAYRRDGADTLLLTNEHVASWPPVTDDRHVVDGVPAGCKRISDSLKIVDDDHDGYAGDDVALSRVVVDPGLDVAVLRAHAKLAIIPWRVGKSAALVARNAVQVKGFPLGEFQATNVGKVVSPYDRDVQGERNHDDFVIDALLTSGGSGSPVFAVSCATGEFELVGIFHARYTGASALNVVVAIDQVRDLMTTLKRSAKPPDHVLDLDAAARVRLIEAVKQDPDPPYFSVGPLVASVRVRGDGALVYAVYAADFPRTSAALMAIEDLGVDERSKSGGGDPTGSAGGAGADGRRGGNEAKSFGALGATYLGDATGLREYAAKDADAEVHAALSRTLDALREAALAAFDYRAATRTAAGSRTVFKQITAKRRTLEHTLDGQRDTAQLIIDVAGRELAKASGATLAIADIEAGPVVAAPAVSAPDLSATTAH